MPDETSSKYKRVHNVKHDVEEMHSLAFRACIRQRHYGWGGPTRTLRSFTTEL